MPFTWVTYAFFEVADEHAAEMEAILSGPTDSKVYSMISYEFQVDVHGIPATLEVQHAPTELLKNIVKRRVAIIDAMPLAKDEQGEPEDG